MSRKHAGRPDRVPTLHNIPYQNFGCALRRGAALTLLSGCGPLHSAWLPESAPLEVPSELVDLGPALLDGVVTASLPVTSTADGPVRVAATAEDDTGAAADAFQVLPGRFDLAPGETRTLQVSFVHARPEPPVAAWPTA